MFTVQFIKFKTKTAAKEMLNTIKTDTLSPALLKEFDQLKIQV